MSRTATRLAVLLLSTAASIWGTPAAAQQRDPAPSVASCTGDYVCTDPSVVATWPIERWAQVRRQSTQVSASARVRATHRQ